MKYKNHLFTIVIVTLILLVTPIIFAQDEILKFSDEQLELLNLDKDGKIISTKEQPLIIEKTGFYKIKGNKVYLSKGANININDKGKVSMGVKSGTEIKPPEKIDDNSEDIKFSIITNAKQPINVRFKKDEDPVPIFGQVNYDKEGFYISGDNEETINGLKKTIPFKIGGTFDEPELELTNNKEKVYLDTKGAMKRDWAKTTYLSFNKEKKIITLETKNENFINQISLELKKGNPYLQIDEGDEFKIVATSKGSVISISPIGPDLIPFVSTIGDAYIFDDSIVIFKDHGEPIQLGKTESFSTSTPIILQSTFDKKEGLTKEELLKTKVQIYFIDNANRVAALDDTNTILESFKEESNIRVKDLIEGLEFDFSSRVRKNYLTVSEVEKIISTGARFKRKIVIDNEYSVSKGGKDLALLRLKDYYNTLTEESKRTISLSKILLQSIIPSAKFQSGTAGGMYFPSSKEISMSPEYFNFANFRHEWTHAIHDGNLDSINNQIDNIINKNYYLNSINFQINWPNDNSLSQKEINELETTYNKYKISWKIRPRDGFINPYAKNNRDESFASTVEIAVKNPNLYAALIDLKSDIYVKKDSIIYRKMLDLTQFTGAISDDEYIKIIKLANLNQQLSQK